MEDQLKQAIKKAEQIVNDSGIGENIKSTAFNEVFRVLWHNEVKIYQQNTKPEAVTDIREPKKKAASRTNSPSILIEKMITEGYFQEKKKDTDCQNHLKISGFNIPRKQLATVLLRKVRSSRLKREKTSDESYVYFT